jgi:hypothetical protein
LNEEKGTRILDFGFCPSLLKVDYLNVSLYAIKLEKILADGSELGLTLF